MMVYLLPILLLSLAFGGIAIKILLKKDGEFAGTCASNNPMFQNDEGSCSFCGAKPEEKCKSSES
ncbi:MAG: membrane or secreted protein [Crocinitomicaceae bacterium]|tara:strand:+ start:305 stop:499 length:195 start_codon:yes stop_codon:yes gene_type:complete